MKSLNCGTDHGLLLSAYFDVFGKPTHECLDALKEDIWGIENSKAYKKKRLQNWFARVG